MRALLWALDDMASYRGGAALLLLGDVERGRRRVLGTEEGLPEALLLLFPAHLDSSGVEVAVWTRCDLVVMGGVEEA